jgi:hypothetical protein
MPEVQELETVVGPRLGEDGEPCAECGAPLAHDQRYCLHCGRRRAAARIPFLDILREEYGQQQQIAAAAVEEEHKDEREREAASPQVAWAIVGGFLLLLVGLGVLIGLVAGGGNSATTAGTPQVLQVGGAAGAGTAAAAGFKSDWPAGKDGWTVQIETLPKAGTTAAAVEQAKTAASGKGATAVGALDSDKFKSLDAGKYLI